MTEAQHSDAMKNLVLFIVCLAIAGSFVAGLYYFAIDLPQQKNIKAPENRKYTVEIDVNDCEEACYFNEFLPCWKACLAKHPDWDLIGRGVCGGWCQANVRDPCYDKCH